VVGQRGEDPGAAVADAFGYGVFQLTPENRLA
jgi:hypothetical protein